EGALDGLDQVLRTERLVERARDLTALHELLPHLGLRAHQHDRNRVELRVLAHDLAELPRAHPGQRRVEHDGLDLRGSQLLETGAPIVRDDGDIAVARKDRTYELANRRTVVDDENPRAHR